MVLDLLKKLLKKYWSPYEISVRQKDLFEFIFDRWIKYDGLELSKMDFINLAKENNLLIKNYPELIDDVKQKLQALDLSNERDNKESNEKESKEWFSTLASFFDKDTYWLGLNSKNVAYVENKFTFTRKEDYLRCGFKKKDLLFRFDYYYATGILKIEIWGIKNNEWVIQSDLDSLDKDAQYFIRTFNRYLRRNYGQNAIIFDENNIVNNDAREDVTHYTEEEYFTRRKANTEMIELFCKLKDKLFEKYSDIEEYCTNNYIAFRKIKNFAEVHIYKDSIQVNIRDIGIESKLGGRLPDSYNWVWKYQFNIQGAGQIDEALVLISQSYDIVNK